MQRYRHLDLIIGLFVAVLLISNLASAAKIVVIGPFVYDAGTLLFPLSYIFGDILTEVYGYAVSRRIIWIGFLAALLMAATLALVSVLPGEAAWSTRVGQEAYNNILGATPPHCRSQPACVPGRLVLQCLYPGTHEGAHRGAMAMVSHHWLHHCRASRRYIGLHSGRLCFCRRVLCSPAMEHHSIELCLQSQCRGAVHPAHVPAHRLSQAF